MEHQTALSRRIRAQQVGYVKKNKVQTGVFLGVLFGGVSLAWRFDELKESIAFVAILITVFVLWVSVGHDTKGFSDDFFD